MPRRVPLALLAVLLAAAPMPAAAPTAVALAASPVARESVQPAGVLAEGTRWATPYYVVDSGKPGPTVMVTGGIHGNEPAGALAAGQIRHWALARGKLVVIPRANVPGLEANQRRLPDVDAEASDLNRNFPQADGAVPRGQPAEAIWHLVRTLRPDWLVDMHESAGFRKEDPKRVGNTIIHAVADDTRRQALAMIEAVNAGIPDEPKQFLLLKNPAKGSLVRSSADRLGVRAVIVETTWPKQPLPLRVRQHRLMVHRLLADLGMAACDADTLLPPRRDGGPVRVAIYDGGGSGPVPPQLEKTLPESGQSRIARIGEAEVRGAVLKQFDVLIVPGGSASKQAAAMTADGREAVRDFIRRGGGYVGLCAGAYLATSHYKWSLGLLDAAVLDTKHWRRGKGTVQIELTDEGRRLLGHEPGPFDIHYANGPLLAPGKREDLPDFRTLAHFRGDMAQHGAPEGVMPGTVAIACGRFGQGRVIVFSPHAEKTGGLEAFVQRAVQWAARK